MEQRHARPSMRLQRTLSKQASVVDDERDEGIVAEVIPVSNGSPLPSESPPQLPLQTVSPSTSPLVPRSISPNTITASPKLTVTTSSPGPPSFTESNNHGQEKSRAESPIPVHNNSNGNNNVSSFSSNQRSKSLDLPQHQDIDKEQPLVTSARHRHHGGKLRLQRSHAMRDDSSPPPDYREPSPIQNHPSPHSNTLTVGGRRRGFRHQGSSQGSYESSSPCLSRDSSMEYTDSSGVDLQQFIIQTLHKNQKDRMMLLKIEHELVSLVKDSKRTHHKFGPMSSYQRMLVHRCAAFFGLEHNVDQAGTAVIVNKTRCTRLPDIRFRDHCRDDFLSPDEPKRSILKRDSCSFDDGSGYKSSDREHSSDSRRSKSFEEREEDYVKVRRRIFSQESLCSMDGLLDSPERRHDSRRNSQDESRWHDSRQWNFMDSENHHRKHQHDNHRLRPCRLPKVESFESRETLHPRSLRPPVFKSHSFGGYSGGVTVLSRGDSVSSNQSSSRLSKQDSTSSRISDHSSSSGYKTQRQDTSSTSVSNTMSTTPSPTTSHHQHQPNFGVWGGEGDSQPVMWAVTDMEAVPAGAMLINPTSGQPYVNDDGSVYRFDPNNPPQVSRTSSTDQENTEKDQLSEKHRSSPASSSDNCPLDEREVPLTSSSSPLDPTTSSCESLSTTPSTAVARASSQQQKQTTPEPSQGAVSKESGSQESSSTEGNTAPNNPQVIYSHYYNQQSLETKQYSQTGGCGDVSAQLRSLCISGGAGAGTGSGEGTVDPSSITPASVTPAQHSFIMSRQQYTQQPVYYLPPCSSANGSMKYVYPQYQMAPVGPQSVSGLPAAAAMQQVQTLPGMAAIQAVPPPPPIAAPCAHAHPPAAPTAIDHSNGPPVGYLPGSYTVVTYPTPGGVVPGTTGAAQESGGTTYYYQVPVGGSNNVTGAPPPPCLPPTSLQQPYAITSTPSTTTFPHGLHSGILYSGGGIGGGGVGGGGVYPSIGGMAAAAAAAAGSISAAGGKMFKVLSWDHDDIQHRLYGRRACCHPTSTPTTAVRGTWRPPTSPPRLSHTSSPSVCKALYWYHHSS